MEFLNTDLCYGIKGSRAAQGGGWSPYGIHMKATSTMWEVNGGLFFHPSY